MIKAESTSAPLLTTFTNGTHAAQADSTPDHGGNNEGFRPHELLEAALATCMNMTIRMSARKHNVPLSGVTVSVNLNRSRLDAPVFEWQVHFADALTTEHRERLLSAVSRCPVHQTLSKSLQFKMVEGQG
jgi:putative redox protein